MYPAAGALTYEPFFGLREKPFSLSADPRFLFRSPAHAPAFDALLAGIRRREGLIVLTGEIGTGKTTLCRSVLEHLDRRTFSAFVPDPFVSREDLLKTLLVNFGVVSIGDLTSGRFNGASRSDLSFPLYEFLDSLVPLQAFAVLVIDETQNLSLPLLEEIRILSELERREKLLQVVLVGQPELRSNLRLPQMRQVDQRVSVRCELKALDADGVAGYVSHRLLVAGCGDSRVEFTRSALDAVYEGSGGVPRVINRLCDRVLDRACAAQSVRIDEHLVRDAIDDLGLTPVSHDRSSAEKLSPHEPVPRAEMPPSPLESVPIIARTDDAPSFLEDFASEVAPAMAPPASTAPATERQMWTAVAAAATLVVLASVGVPTWYLRARMVDDGAVAALMPPPAPRAVPQPRLQLPEVEPVESPSPQDHNGAPGSATAGPVAGDYTIVVASFATRTRAESLVEDLATAGYRAQVIERDWGPPRGRLFHVNVGGYASAIDVQRDLQHIRDLPGGYRDARIVERQ